MAQLAIKGHPTRGKEVIEILEMLGGSNPNNYSADCESLCFHIGENTNSIYYDWVRDCYEDGNTLVFTLEEFLETYPYKVGDRVKTIYGKIGIVSKPIWSNRDNCIRYELEADTDSFYFINELQPYKEETMESKPDLLQQLKEYFDNTPRDIIEKEWNELSYLNEIGPSVNEYLECVKKYRQLNQYPKTYEECCKVLNIPSNGNIAYVGDWVYGGEYLEKHLDRLRKFQQLLICRDAYWKIAGEQIGLGKPWKPDWENERYSIYSHKNNKIVKGIDVERCIHRHILEFPTEEMRDAFYENFKELIELCKELL